MSGAPLPATIGPFRVLRAIASGGMAEVYEVDDPRTGERFACKLLVAVEVALDRFNREYEAMTRLNHPGIVRVYHYGLHQGHPWMSMELLRGTPAQPWVKRIGKPGTPERTAEVVRVAYHLARALDYAHQRGLIHRDIKSANVLVLPDGRVKLVDFGTAHLADAARRITGEGEFVGTYAYASPEQVSARPIDHRSDIYSLGVLLFRLATGRRPFGTNDPVALVRAHLHDDPPDPRTLAPSLPAELAALILDMMAKHPDDRPASAAVVARRLEQLHGEPFSSASPLTLHEPSCTDRHEERARIRTHFQDRPHGALAVVVGDLGSDRERMVDSVVQERLENKDRVFLCALRPGRDVDDLLGMLRQIARQGDDGLDAVRQLRTLARSRPRQLARKAVRKRLRTTCFEVLRHMGSVTLGVHGLEHASPLTLEIVMGLQILARQEAVPLALVADCTPASLQGGTELARRLPEALVVPLDPLDSRTIAIAVGRMLGRRPPPSELARRLHRVTDGRAIYVEDAVRTLVRANILEAEDNRLEWASRHVDISLPPTAMEDATTILGDLPHLHRRVLEAFALCDEDVAVEVLANALDWEPEAVTWILEELARRQIVHLDGARVYWRLVRLRPLLRQRMATSRRAVHEQLLARAIHERAPRPAQIRLLLAVGQTRTAMERSITVARRALARGDYRGAYELLLPIVERGGTPTTPLHGEIHMLFARCVQVLHPMDPAGARALATARKVMGGTPNRMAELDLITAYQAQRIGHQGIFEKYLDSAWVAGSEANDPTLRSRIAIELARVALHHGQLKDASRWVKQAQQAAVHAGPSAMGATTLVEAQIAMRQGDLQTGLERAERVVQFFEQEHMALEHWSAVAVWAEGARRAGRYSEALTTLAVCLADAREAQDPSVYLQLLLAAAWCEVELGRLGRSQELLDEIDATVRRGELLALRLEARLAYGRVLLVSGQYENAAFVLRETHERAKNAHLDVLSQSSRAALAETLHHLGDEQESQQLFKFALLGLKGMGDRLALVDAICARGRTVTASDDLDALFRAVAPLLETQTLPTLEIELLLAHGRQARLLGDTARWVEYSKRAARALNRLASRLDDTERAALRVHPWSRRIRLGLTAAG